MAQALRYHITSPATSREFTQRMRAAIDDGSYRIPIVAQLIEGIEQIETCFTLHGSHYGDRLMKRYSGKLDTGELVTISVHTHVSYENTKAQLALNRQTAP